MGMEESRNAVTWTRLSFRTMRGNAVRLPLHALACNLANVLRTLANVADLRRASP